MLLPADIGEKIHELNQNQILEQLNNGNIFDVELQHRDNDILEVHLSIQPGIEQYIWQGNFLVYAFKFFQGKWENDDYDPYQLEFDEIEKGKILSPFKAKS